MIRHTLLFEPRKDLSHEQFEELLAGLRDFPNRYPTMKRFCLGPNISKRDTTFSYVMTMEFDSVEELEAYLRSEYHQQFVEFMFLPKVERRAIATMDDQAL